MVIEWDLKVSIAKPWHGSILVLECRVLVAIVLFLQQI